MSLPNEFKTLSWIANKGLAYLLATMPFIKCGSSEYNSQFDNREYAKGDTIQVRRSNRRIGGEGATINLDGVVEKTDTLTIEKQFNDGLVFSTREQALFMTGEEGMEVYAERYIKPSILSLVSKINFYMAEKAVEDLVYTTGSAASPINSFSTLANLRATMADLHMPIEEYENYLIVSPQDDAALKSSMPSLFLPKNNDKVFNKYFLTSLADFDYQNTATVYKHIAGAASNTTTYPVGTLTVKTDVTSGNTITVTGFGGAVTGVFVKGDVIRVAGSHIVVPNPYRTTEQGATFIVTDTSVNSDIAGDAVVHVKQEVIIDPANPFRNLDLKLAATSVVTCEPSHKANTAFTKGCLSYAMPRMQKMWTPYCVDVTDKDFGTGISLRLSKGSDIVNDQNIMRWDVLVGARWWYEYGVRVMSKIG